MIFQYDPYAMFMLLSGVISSILAGMVWSRHPARGVIPLTILMLAVTLWSIGSAMEIFLVPMSLKYAFVWLVYLSITIIPPALLVFVLEYTGRDSWITRRTLLLLTIHPVVVSLLVMSNPWHGLFWSDITLDATTHIATYTANVLFWVHAVYSYGLLLFGAALLASAFMRSPHLYRGQITALMVAQVVPWVANGLYITRTTPLPHYVDLTPIGFMVTGVVTAWSLYRFSFMDIAPVAHYAIFNSMSEAVFVVDAKNRIVDANQSALKMLNLSAKQVIGQPIALVFAGRSSLLKRYGSVENILDEFTAYNNGQEYIFQIRVSPLRDSQGAVSGRTIVLHDITRLKQTNRELEEARIKADESTRLKSEFLATVSHELRTPLNAIMGYAGLMSVGMMGELDDKTKHAVNRIEDNSNYLLHLINNILDLSKIEAGHIEITYAPTSIRDLAAEWGRQVSILADEKNLDLLVHVAPDMPPQLLIDQKHLSQVAINLLSNAVKFTEQGQVVLSIKRNSDTDWILAVEDTGIGIAPQAQKYIFDEFRQIDGSDQTAYGGTGLGLAIVHKLICQMNGTVWVESEPQQGSTFFVKLPLQPVGQLVH